MTDPQITDPQRGPTAPHGLSANAIRAIVRITLFVIAGWGTWRLMPLLLTGDQRISRCYAVDVRRRSAREWLAGPHV